MTLSLSRPRSTGSSRTCIALHMPQIPPKWLQAWRRMVRALKHAEILLARVLVQATLLGIRDREWLACQDPLYMGEKEQLLKTALGPCEHKRQTRYGNRHGSYSKCQDCGKKWKWDQGLAKWVEPMSRKGCVPLPLPSSSNTATNFVDTRHTPALRMGLSIQPLNYTQPSWSSPSTSEPPSSPARALAAPGTPESTLWCTPESTARSKSETKPAKRKPKVETETYNVDSDDSFDWEKVPEPTP